VVWSIIYVHSTVGDVEGKIGSPIVDVKGKMISSGYQTKFPGVIGKGRRDRSRRIIDFFGGEEGGSTGVILSKWRTRSFETRVGGRRFTRSGVVVRGFVVDVLPKGFGDRRGHF
jgi:hypothetical protein